MPDNVAPVRDGAEIYISPLLEKVRCDINNDIPVAPNVSLEATLDGVP